MVFFKEVLLAIFDKTFGEVLEDLSGFWRGNEVRDICFA